MCSTYLHIHLGLPFWGATLYKQLACLWRFFCDTSLHQSLQTSTAARRSLSLSLWARNRCPECFPASQWLLSNSIPCIFNSFQCLKVHSIISSVVGNDSQYMAAPTIIKKIAGTIHMKELSQSQNSLHWNSSKFQTKNTAESISPLKIITPSFKPWTCATVIWFTLVRQVGKSKNRLHLSSDGTY